MGSSGLSIEDFNEYSFSWYTEIYFSPVELLTPNPQTPSSGWTLSGAMISENTWSTVGSGTSLSWGVLFPNILPEIQNYTDATYSENTFSCTKNPCRINLNFDSIFSSSFPKSKYTCSVLLWSQKYTTCNPPQFEVSSSTDIIVTLTSQNSEKHQIFSIIFPETNTISGTFVSPPQNTPTLLNHSLSTATIPTQNSISNPDFSLPPILTIHSDGNYSWEYIWKSDTEIACLKTPCSLNLNASGSYSPQWKSLKYTWKFWSYGEKSWKNPGAIKLPSGIHDISLVVTDSLGNAVWRNISVFVPENLQDESAISTATRKSDASEKISSVLPDFSQLSPPELSIQNNSNIFLDNTHITCVTKNEYCSINLTLSGTHQGLLYSWKWDQEDEFISINPKSRSLSIWEHTLIITSKTTSGDIISQDAYTVTVQKANPPSSVSKTLKKTSITPKKKTTSSKKSSSAKKVSSTKSTKQTTTSKKNSSPQEQNATNTSSEILDIDSDTRSNQTFGFSLASLFLVSSYFYNQLRKDRIQANKYSHIKENSEIN